MKIQKPFDPIEVGEIDNFAFDFSYDMGSAVIVAAAFTCTVAPFQNIFDPFPQSHVLSVTAQTTIAIRVEPGAMLLFQPGNYVVASIGGMTIASAGGTYVLEAIATLNDGRILALNSTVLCKLPGD